MKKLIAILAVMVVLVGVVFAADPVEAGTITLKSTVGQVLPVYEIRSASAAGTLGTVSVATVPHGAEVATSKDISVENIEWVFYIMQKGEVDSKSTAVEFAKTKKTATLTITLGHFTGKEELQVANDNPVFTAFTAATATGANANVAAAKKTVITVPEESDFDSSTATVTVAYKGVNWADQEIAHFTALWTKDDTLEMDDYYADIKLTYTIQ